MYIRVWIYAHEYSAFGPKESVDSPGVIGGWEPINVDAEK